MTDQTKIRLCLCIAGIGLANFFAFFVAVLCLGGDAVNGKIAAGHYYLMSHGRYTEVNEAVFAYSKWHVYSLWITHPLAFAACVFYYRLKKKAAR